MALASDLRFEEEAGIPRKYGDGGVSLVEKLKGLHRGADIYSLRASRHLGDLWFWGKADDLRMSDIPGRG